MKKEDDIYILKIEINKQKNILDNLLEYQKSIALDVERATNCINALQVALEAIKATYRQ